MDALEAKKRARAERFGIEYKAESDSGKTKRQKSGGSAELDEKKKQVGPLQ